MGSSMFPLLKTGSVIHVEPVTAADLHPGDVMVYQRAGEAVVAHRLVQKSWKHGRLTLLARGDSFSRPAQEDVTPGQVLGRVVAVEWEKGMEIRIDAGWGRALGIILAAIAPLVWRVAPALSRIKGSLKPLWMGRTQS
jgi:signal peptidase I